MHKDQCKLCSFGVGSEDELSQRELARKYGVSKSSVARHRKALEKGISVEPLLGVVSPAPTTIDLDGLELLGGTIRDPATGSWYRYSAPSTVTTEGYESSLPSADDLEKAIENFSYEPLAFDEEEELSLIVNFSDLQVGKVDVLGGTDELITRTLRSAHRVAEKAKALRPREIVFIDPGDTVEGMYNTSSQRETNDRDTVNQIRTARRLILEVIKILVPLAPKFTYIAVPSNHCQVRIAPKSPAGNSHNDWGLEIQEQIRDVCQESEYLNHVKFVAPETHLESVSYTTTDGTKIGVVHGHQTKGQDKISDWWQGQALGKMPVGDSDILVVGHWHNLRVQTTGSARTIFVCPTLDNGSSWFSNISGEQSNPGVLTFTTHGGLWGDLEIC